MNPVSIIENPVETISLLSPHSLKSLTAHSPQTTEERKNQKLWTLMATYLDTGMNSYPA